MKDDVALIDKLGRHWLVVDVLYRVVKARILFQMADIFDAAGGQIVDDEDLVAVLQIRVGKMRANETRPARDQNSQTIAPLQTIVSDTRRKFSTIVPGSSFISCNGALPHGRATAPSTPTQID